MKKIALIVIALLMLTAQKCTVPWADASSVAIIGDSITYLTTDEILDELVDYDVNILGVPGARVDEMQETADQFAAQKPGQIVVNLGTNNLNQQLTVESATSELDVMLTKFSRSKCKHLVTITDSTMSAEWNEKARTINAWMKAKTDVNVIDWADHLRSHPGLTSDLVHPDEEGQDALAGLIRDAVDAC